jgi:hypothetical protein
MTPELQKYYETLFSLFVHEGWKLFQDEVKDSINSLRFQLVDVKPEETERAKGYIKALESIQTFQVLVEKAYKDQVEPDVDI